MILVKITIKSILICLSNSFCNSFMKTKNEKRTLSRFPFFYENEKRMKALKIMCVWKVPFVFQFKIEMKIRTLVNFDFCPNIEF